MSKWGNPTAQPIKYELKVQRSTHKYSLEQGMHCFPPSLSVAPLISAPLCIREASSFNLFFFSSWVTTLFMTVNVSSPSVCSLYTHTESAPSLCPTLVFQSGRMKGFPPGADVAGDVVLAAVSGWGRQRVSPQPPPARPRDGP